MRRSTKGYTKFEPGQALTGVIQAQLIAPLPDVIPEADSLPDVAMGEGVRVGGSRHFRRCVGCTSRSWRIEDSGVDHPCCRVQEQVVPHGRVSQSITRTADSRPTMRVRRTLVPIHFMVASRSLVVCGRGVL